MYFRKIKKMKTKKEIKRKFKEELNNLSIETLKEDERVFFTDFLSNGCLKIRK